ncbi:MAG: hypothetical protein ABSH53_13960 [Holophaga sp.]|jgi:hypothetical protein
MATILRNALVTGGLAVFWGASLHAGMDANKWSKVENNSGKDYDIFNYDLTDTTSWGGLYIKEQGASGDGTKVIARGKPFTLKNKKKYVFYFNTTLKKFAKHLRFTPTDSKDETGSIYVHVTNITTDLKGFHIDVSTNTLEPSLAKLLRTSVPMWAGNLVVDPTGFRNNKGGVLFNLRAPAAAPDADASTAEVDKDGSPGWTTSPNKWSKVENNSGEDFDVFNYDLTDATSLGGLYVKEQGGTGDPFKLIARGKPYTLKNKKKYLFYFNTTLGAFAKHLRLTPTKSKNEEGSIYVHVTNVTSDLKGYHLDVSTNNLEPSLSKLLKSSNSLWKGNLVVDPTGFRNLNGGVLFNLRAPVPPPDAKGGDDTDD